MGDLALTLADANSSSGNVCSPTGAGYFVAGHTLETGSVFAPCLPQTFFRHPKHPFPGLPDPASSLARTSPPRLLRRYRYGVY